MWEQENIGPKQDSQSLLRSPMPGGGEHVLNVQCSVLHIQKMHI